MAHPTEHARKLLKYLVETCPSALEVRNSDGDTPLMTACWFGRTDFVKILIEAGADQSVCNKAGYNVVHKAIHGKPKARQLRPLLELLDADLLQHLFLSRSSLHESGATPFQSFVSAVTARLYYSHSEARYEKTEHWLETVKLLLEFSKGAELEMLNGAGDTCLHTAVMNASAPMVQALVDFKPKLLYRENAVGITPAEVARDRVTAEKFGQPGILTVPNTNRPVTTLIGTPAPQFAETKDKEREETAKVQVWRICLEAMEKNPDKRRLVSLNEANDVAKRLGEKYNASRYFSIQAREDDDDEEKEEDKEEPKHVDDFSVRQRNAKWREQWVCPKCYKRHED